jgi:hypothetical protein
MHAEFAKDAAASGAVVVSTDALKKTGIDVEVRAGDAPIASATALHHALLRPGGALFKGGLRFGAKDKGLPDVLYRIEPAQ